MKFIRNCVRRLIQPSRARVYQVCMAMTRLSTRPLFPPTERLAEFGKLYLTYSFRNNYVHANGINWGDDFQSIAVEAALRRVIGADVPIKHWVHSELTNYDGPPAVCVMNAWFAYGTLNFLPNERVLPVWVGTHFSNPIRGPLRYLVKLQPDTWYNQEIGCRDLSTFDWCRKHGLRAYFSRCLTLTYPHRLTSPAHSGTVFLVGPEEWRQAILPYLPKSIRDNCVVCDQSVLPLYGKAAYMRRETAYALLNRYRDEASLIITSRLHCAQPCLAMGIPVVHVNPDYNEADRFSSMQGLIPSWTFDDLRAGRVDLNPDPVDFEPLKKAMLKNLELSIKATLGEPVEREELETLRERIRTFSV